MIEIAKVVRAEKGKAVVELQWNQACTSCHSKTACHFGSEVPSCTVEVVDPVGVCPGDLVKVKLPQPGRLLLSVLVFGVPVCLLLIGYFVGSQFAEDSRTEWPGVAGAFAGFVASGLVLPGLDRVLRQRITTVPQILPKKG